MNLQAGWDGTWQEFLSMDKASFLKSLVAFYGHLSWTQDLDPAQYYAWEIEFDVMQATLSHVIAESRVTPNKCWIAFEQELIGEGGKRAADVNLVTPTGDLFVIEFKHKKEASEYEIIRANSDLQTMSRYHSESIDLSGYGFIVLTKPGAKAFQHSSVICDITDHSFAPKLTEMLIGSLCKTLSMMYLTGRKVNFTVSPVFCMARHKFSSKQKFRHLKHQRVKILKKHERHFLNSISMRKIRNKGMLLSFMGDLVPEKHYWVLALWRKLRVQRVQSRVNRFFCLAMDL